MPVNSPATPVAGTTDEYRPGGWNMYYVGIILVMMLMGEVGFFTAAYPINALPEIGAHFHTSQAIWIPTIYFLVAGLVSPFTGTLADRFGKKRFLVLNLVLGIVGLLISTFAPTFAIMLVGRVLQAPILTFPFLLPSLTRDIFPTKTIPMAASLAVTGAGILGVPAQLMSGPIIEHLGFRAAFWVPAIVAAVVLVLLLLVIPESKVRQVAGKVDLVGAFLLGGGVAIVLVGVSFGPAWGWSSPRVLGAFAVGVALLIGWIIQATRVRYPLVDLREFTSGPVLFTMLFAGIGMGISSWYQSVLPTIALLPTANSGLGLDPTQQTQLAAIFGFGGFLAGWLVGYSLSKRAPSTVAAVALALASGGFAIAYLSLTSVFMFALSTLLIGIGGAGAMTVGYNLVIRLIAPQRQAVMSSTFSLFFNLMASALSVVLFAVMNSLGTADPKSGTVVYNHAALTAATVIPIAIGLIGIACAVTVRVMMSARRVTRGAPVLDAAPCTPAAAEAEL